MPAPVPRAADVGERRLRLRTARRVRGRRRGRGHAPAAAPARSPARGRARRRARSPPRRRRSRRRGAAAAVDVDPPAPVSIADAEAARERHVRDWSPDFGECYVCGVREDGLEIRVGPVAGREPLHAAPVALLETGTEFVWAAIDCPGAYAVGAEGRGDIVLGRMTARVRPRARRRRGVRRHRLATRRGRPQALRGDGALRR